MFEFIAYCKHRHDVVCNQKYDKVHPYSFHLRLVDVQYEKWKHLLTIPELAVVKRAVWGHDLIEDARVTYHNVRDKTAYPSVLFLTGANDPRVDPMHSRKMTARLQAASSSGRPVLLRTSSKTGHGLATPLSEQINKSVHYYAFLLNELGL